jgi:hypothetical protein
MGSHPHFDQKNTPICTDAEAGTLFSKEAGIEGGRGPHKRHKAELK